jgi:acetolactate synthase I/II/III large subunit
MIRVADYIAKTLVEQGIQDIFLLTGGGAMHLNDAFGRCPGLSYFCCHHEQALAMAAESYYRLTNRLAAVNVTTGPGGTNAITGVYGAWTDSIGMIVVSGQVKWETVVRSTDLPLRQLGDQELDIVKLVEPITKYAVMVTDPQTIRYHLEKAIHLARTGRPGPCWVDVPMNVQGAKIDPDSLVGYDPSEDAIQFTTPDLEEISEKIIARLATAERPVIYAGSGIRLSRTHEDFLKLVDRWQIPVVTAWNAHDLIWNEHPYYIGRPGTIGDRAGNFAVQNADVLLVLGSRLNIRQVSYNWENFARTAYKIIVDIDEAELKKPTIQPDFPVHADLADLLPRLLQLEVAPAEKHRAWLDWCLVRKDKYPAVLPEYWLNEKAVNPYCFGEALFKELPEDEIVVTGDGTACVTTFQAAYIKKGQRLYTNSGCASMGYDLPAAIGACIGSGRKRVICIAGDGSMQMNLQELQTIAGYRLPIKIFVLNNQGYHSIRQTQKNFFPDNIVGCGPESGVTFPSFEKLAAAYEIPYQLCDRHSTLSDSIRASIEGEGPQMCEIVLDLDQAFAPKLSSRRQEDGRMISSPLEDLSPFLDREEFLSNMLVPPLGE